MSLVADEIRRRLHDAAVAIPDEPECPPSDVAELQLRIMAQRLSALAIELGVEFDFQLYPGSLINGARSSQKIALALAKCSVAAESTAVVCGIDLPTTISSLSPLIYDDLTRSQFPR